VTDGKGRRGENERKREREREKREGGREREIQLGGEEGAWRTGRSLRSSAGSSAATGRGDLDVATRGASWKSESIRER